MLGVWRLIDLGARDGYTIQSVYEAVAYTVGRGDEPNTIILTYPSSPYVCIGVHQLPELEVDLEYCASKGYSIVRRQVGGGAVYLDSLQQFYHVIVRSDDELAMKGVEYFFRTILKAIVEFYRSYGLKSEYKPPNDVLVNGRKASGNGAATLYNSMVLIGNVILDFNYDEAARILRVPSEKMRDKIASSIREWVTSLKRELGYIPERREVCERLVKCFENTLGIKLVPGALDATEEELLAKVRSRLMSREWLYAKSAGREYILSRYAPGVRVVKVKANHYISYYDYREGGSRTIRVIVELEDNTIKDLVLSGDFFINPPYILEEIENLLRNKHVNKLNEVVTELENTISKAKESVGIDADSVLKAVKKAVENVFNT